MLRLAGIVISVGLADSLNPSTVGPALYISTGRRPVLRVSLFALGVFAVTVVAASVSIAEKVLLITLYCLAFVLPLVAVAAILLVAGERADPWLERGGAWVQRRWPVVLAALLIVVGGGLTVLGGTGLVKH